MSVTESTQAELTRTVGRMLQLLAATPDDRLNWQPVPQARSIVQIVAHSAGSLGNILMQLRGTPFPVPTSAEANGHFLAHDAEFQERGQVQEYLEAKLVEYVQFLETLEPEDLGRMVPLPFGLGEAPLGYMMTMGNLHTMGHIAQIEYIQTLYGDRDWHTGF